MSHIRMLVVSMILFGSLNTIVRKAQMVTCVPSDSALENSASDDCPQPSQEQFNKPWIGNLFMFMGEVLLIFVVRSQRDHPLIAPHGQRLPKTPFWYFVVPASLDVVGSGLSGVGMLFISASVWQMLRGSLIIYTAALSVFWLKRELLRVHYWGLILAATGLTLVGVSSWLDSTVSSYYTGGYDAAVGIMLTVLSQFCTAVQIVIEEHIMKSASYTQPSPGQVVAYEGIIGSAIMIVVLVIMQFIDGSDHGSYENSIDSLEKLSGSSVLIVLVLVYLVSIALFNYSGLAISKHMSSVHRTLIDSSRSIVVWVFQLVMWYIFDSSLYGSSWTAYSVIQLSGFIFIVAGTLVYNEVGSGTVPRRTQESEYGGGGINQPLVLELDEIHH